MFWLGRNAAIERARECAERAADELLSPHGSEAEATTEADDEAGVDMFGVKRRAAVRDPRGESFGGHGDGEHGDDGGAILKCALHDMHHAKRYNAELLDVDPSGRPGGGTGALLSEIRSQFSFDFHKTGPNFFRKADQISGLLLAHYRQFEDLSRGLLYRALWLTFLISLAGLLGMQVVSAANTPVAPVPREPVIAFDETWREPPPPEFILAGIKGSARDGDQSVSPEPETAAPDPTQAAPYGSEDAPVEPPPVESLPPSSEPPPATWRYLIIQLTPAVVGIVEVLAVAAVVLLSNWQMSTLYMACANGFLIVRNRFRSALMLYFHDLYALMEKAVSSAQSSTVSNRREKQDSAYNAAIQAQYLGRGAELTIQYATHNLKRGTQSIQMENMGYFPGARMKALPGMPKPFWWHIGSSKTAPSGPSNKVFYFPTKGIFTRRENGRSYLPAASFLMFLGLVFTALLFDTGVQLYLAHVLHGKPVPDLMATYCWCQEGMNEVPKFYSKGVNWNAVFVDLIGPVAAERWPFWMVVVMGFYLMVSARHLRRMTKNNFAVQLLTPRGLPPHLIAQYGLLGEHVDPAGTGRGFSLEPDAHGHYFEEVAALVREIWALVHAQKTHYPDN